MKLYSILCLLLLCAVVARSSQYNPIRSLPTYHKDIKGQYTGYLTVGQTKEYYFWFAESLNNPSTDPVVLFLSGGPGCSSLLALFTENGPFTAMKDVRRSGDDKYYIVDNPYSWINAANMLYIESPCGVGFSYNTDGNYTSGDAQTAEDNMAALQEFFTLFPQYSQNSFYITGESYAGHYVPQLAALILSTPSSGINIKGVMVGNPSFNYTVDAQFYPTFMAFHGLLSYNDYMNMSNVCNGEFYPGTPECLAIQNQLSANFDLINPYNIYAPCVGEGPSSGGACFTTNAALLGNSRYHVRASQVFIPCLDESALVGYLNRADVQKAIYANTDNIPSGSWQPCSPVLNYTSILEDIPQTYQVLISHGMNILVYSGDVDSCVPYLGTSQAVEQLGYPVSDAWRPWIVVDSENYKQVAGYIVSYNTAKNNPSASLSYATVKGAGHMVPMYKPIEALALFERFLSSGPY